MHHPVPEHMQPRKKNTAPQQKQIQFFSTAFFNVRKEKTEDQFNPDLIWV
jgi:hypothetical protein